MSKHEKKVLRPGEARIEFIRNIDEIKKLISEGYSILQVYNKLKEEKKITMAYRTFLRKIKPNTSE